MLTQTSHDPSLSIRHTHINTYIHTHSHTLVHTTVSTHWSHRSEASCVLPCPRGPKHDGGLCSVCQIPARDSQPVCLAGQHFSRLYLRQPLEEKDLITTRNIYNSSISGEAGRQGDNKRQTERRMRCMVQRCGFIGVLYLKHTHTHTRWKKKHALKSTHK